MQKQIVQPEGNYYDKYHAQNPIVKWMMKGFFNDISELLGMLEDKPAAIFEAGCGEGEITCFLKGLYPEASIDAFDISEKVISEAEKKNPEINFYVGNIYTMELRKPLKTNVCLRGGGYDIVVCSEVLEHLEEPEKALQKCAEMSKQYILLSVPNEPIWRILNMLRGKYWKDFGNTPGHIQHWSKKAFCKLIEQSGLKLIKVKSPFPWTMVLAAKE